VKYWWDSFKAWYTEDRMRAFYFTWVAVWPFIGVTLGAFGLTLLSTISMFVWLGGNFLMSAFILGVQWGCTPTKTDITNISSEL